MTGPAARPRARARTPSPYGADRPSPPARPSLPSALRSVVRLHRRRAGDVAAIGDRLPDPVGQQRHVDVADAGARQRVYHRVDEGRRAADRGALADALGADRVVRAGGDDLAVQLEARRLPGGGKQVVHVVRAYAVTLGVEGDELHAGHRVRLGQAAHDLSLDDHGVDPDPAVVDRDHVQDIPDTGFRVNLDRDDVDGERPGEVGRIVVGRVLQARLHA